MVYSKPGLKRELEFSKSQSRQVRQQITEPGLVEAGLAKSGQELAVDADIAPDWGGPRLRAGGSGRCG